MGRHGKRQGIYNCVDNDGAILVRESFSQTFSNVPGFLDTNPFGAHCLSNLRKIWILELHAKRNKAGFLMFDVAQVYLRLFHTETCRASQMQPLPVSAKNIASSEASSLSVAARNSGRMGFIAGPFS